MEKTKKQIEDEKVEEENYIHKLDFLTYRIKKVPELYLKEIAKYKQDFLEMFAKLKDEPLTYSKKFCNLVIFLAQISGSFKQDLRFLVEYIEEFLNHYKTQMNPQNRQKLIQAYIIMRSKNLILPVQSISFLFSLLVCQSKELRKVIIAHVINDIKRMNKHSKNMVINKQLQSIIHEVLKKHSDVVAKFCIKIMIQLYKRGLWNDVKTVNIIAGGVFNEYYKIKLISCFFLMESTIPNDDFSEDSDGDDEKMIKDMKDKKITKKTKAKMRVIDREKKKQSKNIAKKLKRLNERNKSFFPIDQIYNQQDYCENLFGILRKSADKFVVKLAIMAVLSRMIGRHKLQILSFYSFLQKYLMPHQKEIGKILTYLAESVHELVPPEELEPVVKHVIENFVNDRCTEEAMCSGLNTIREMCKRNKLLLDDVNLSYLTNYYKYKNKNVSRSAKALINLYRQINPSLLDKQFRGRFDNTDAIDENIIFGYEKVNDDIDGAELIDEGNDIPITMDRILTDEDFKKIRFLRQKRLQEQQQRKIGFQEDTEYSDDDEEEEEEDEGDKEEVNEGEDGEYDKENSAQGEDDSDIMSDLSDEEDDDDQEEGEEDEDQQEKSRKLKEENKKRKVDLEGYSSFEDEIEEEDNPHNFVYHEDISKFKKRKAEWKKEFLDAQKNKIKKKWGPKEKGGGTNNEKKLKQKPLAMLRPKKNKQMGFQLNQLNKVKDLKQQLGHVRSGKQAARLKARKVKMPPRKNVRQNG